MEFPLCFSFQPTHTHLQSLPKLMIKRQCNGCETWVSSRDLVVCKLLHVYCFTCRFRFEVVCTKCGVTDCKTCCYFCKDCYQWTCTACWNKSSKSSTKSSEPHCEGKNCWQNLSPKHCEVCKVTAWTHVCQMCYKYLCTNCVDSSKQRKLKDVCSTQLRIRNGVCGMHPYCKNCQKKTCFFCKQVFYSEMVNVCPTSSCRRIFCFDCASTEHFFYCKVCLPPQCSECKQIIKGEYFEDEDEGGDESWKIWCQACWKNKQDKARVL